MKHISMKIKFGLAAALLASACTNELSENPTDDARAITFAPLAETRAAVDGTELPSNSSFSVWGGYDNNVNNVFNGVTVTGSNGSWSYSGTQYWLPGKEYNFWGVYPANLQGVTISSVGSSAGNIEVKSFDCSATGDAAIDLMTATAPNLLGDNPPDFVNLNFKHELAKVNFIVKSENNAVDITQFKVYNVIYKGSLNPTWGSYTKNEQKDEIYNSSSFSLNNNSKNVFGDVLIIPHDNENLKQANILISYKYSNEEDIKTKTLPLAINNVIDSWESGKSYNYSLTIKPNGITFSGLKADIWEETSSGGNIVIK